MKIALVNPISRSGQGYHTIGTRIPQLGLQVLARLALAAGHQVDIIDEIFATIDTEKRLAEGGYDLVGVTSYTSSATRAYEVAACCRTLGIPSIMGGPHAWAVPEEPAEHFDSVAVGECDEVWPQILADAQQGKLQKRYDGCFSELTGDRGAAAQGLHPLNGRYDVACIQTSRGCPIGCDYCSVTRFNGREIRRRDIGKIIEEWNSTDRKFIFVVDDNFYGVGPKHAEWAKELLRAIIKHGKHKLWFSQTSLNMGDDVEGLKLAYKAGCRAMLVGIESFNPKALAGWKKGLNVKIFDRYKEHVDGFHKAGLAVFGGFVIGSDEDDENTVADTALKAVQLGVDIIQITNMTPLPGTNLFDKLKAEGRLIATNYPKDWERYTFIETVYTPAKMTARRLDETIYELRKAAATQHWVLKRTLKSFWWTKSLTTTLFVNGMNGAWVSLAKGQVPHDEKRLGYTIVPCDRTEKIRKSFNFRSGKLELPPVDGAAGTGIQEPGTETA